MTLFRVLVAAVDGETALVCILNFDYPIGKSPSFVFEQSQEMDWTVHGMRKFGWGHPVPNDSAPPAQAREIDPAPLSDVFPLPGTFAVSAKFKSIIEKFEPGVHQFFPVILKRLPQKKCNSNPDVTYFVLNVCQRFDAVLTGPDRRRPITRYSTGDEDGRPVIEYKGYPKFSKQKIGGRHLWQGNIIGRRGMFVSNALADRLTSEKMKFLSLSRQYEELDVPWDPQENVGPVLDWLESKPDLDKWIGKLHKEC